MAQAMPVAAENPASADTWNGYRLTPMLKQWVAAKQVHPDALLMFRMGDFYELFFDDAKLAARELDITLTARDKSERPIPMAGVPHHAVDGYIGRLVARGHTVALCDQMEDPKQAQGIVRRAVTRLVTPGTLCDLSALEPTRATYLAVVLPIAQAHASAPQAGQGDAPSCALVLLDVLAGELLGTVGSLEGMLDELRRMQAREVLAEPVLMPKIVQALRPEGVRVQAIDAALAQAEPSAPCMAARTPRRARPWRGRRPSLWPMQPAPRASRSRTPLSCASTPSMSIWRWTQRRVPASS